MRKPRDFESELKALDERARQLKARKIHHLGELVVATGADVLPIEALAGAMLRAAEATDTATTEDWRTCGAAFFRRSTRKRGSASASPESTSPNAGGALPLVGGAVAQ